MRGDELQGMLRPTKVKGERDRALLKLVNQLRGVVNQEQYANCRHFVNSPLDQMELILGGKLDPKDVLDAS